MAGNKLSNIRLNTLVKMFLRDYNIATKKDVDRVIARIDRLERTIRALHETPGGRGKSARSGTAARKRSLSDAARVERIIRSGAEGVRFAEIRRQTGFPEKKLRNIIYRLSREGRIQAKNRGVYLIPDTAAGPRE